MKEESELTITNWNSTCRGGHDMVATSPRRIGSRNPNPRPNFIAPLSFMDTWTWYQLFWGNTNSRGAKEKSLLSYPHKTYISTNEIKRNDIQILKGQNYPQKPRRPANSMPQSLLQLPALFRPIFFQWMFFFSFGFLMYLIKNFIFIFVVHLYMPKNNLINTQIYTDANKVYLMFVHHHNKRFWIKKIKI